MTSARYLADHMAEVPAMVIPCIEGRIDGITFCAGEAEAEASALQGEFRPPRQQAAFQ